MGGKGKEEKEREGPKECPKTNSWLPMSSLSIHCILYARSTLLGISRCMHFAT